MLVSGALLDVYGRNRLASSHDRLQGGDLWRGVAAVEGMLRLRSLVGDLVDVTLVAPNDEFVYRPSAVREAVGFVGLAAISSGTCS